MPRPLFRSAIVAAADPVRARHYFIQLEEVLGRSAAGKLSTDQSRLLASLFAGSPAMSDVLIQFPEWLDYLNPELLRHPRRKAGLQRELRACLDRAPAATEPDQRLARLREFKRREMLRIAARDLARLGTVDEIILELSDVADLCLDSICALCRRQLTARFGQPFHQNEHGRWINTPFAVIGLGKLGGQELNYSSDIDLLFIYLQEGVVATHPPKTKSDSGRSLTNHQFFTRLAEAIVQEVTGLAAEGSLYRVDLRLRPEGQSSPIARSLASCENYYAQWGQTWERMMLIKGRHVAGDRELAAEFLEMVQPFRFPRSLTTGILSEVARVKSRIEKEVVAEDEIESNVKLGRGGIREIEFIAQTLQLLHAGRYPFLQDSQTLPTLDKLVRHEFLSESDAQQLAAAYRFLRDVEHRLQMEQGLQTHTIPPDPAPRERLAKLMGFPNYAKFDRAKQQHNQAVRRLFDSILKSSESEAASELPDLNSGEEQWLTLLEQHSFREPARAFPLVKQLVLGPGYVHVSTRTSELALRLVRNLLQRCPLPSVDQPATGRSTLRPEKLSDPDRVLARLDSFITAYGARSTLYETWISNPSLFELMLSLFDRSEFLAEMAIRTPDLVDDLTLSGHLRRRKDRSEILKELRHGSGDASQSIWLRQYHHSELMRLGLRDILGLADFEQNLAELSALADSCLQYALEVTLRKHRIRGEPLAIIGLGKLGGAEINYGSDLDILFLVESGESDMTKPLRVAADVIELLSQPTELGQVFAADARLRPDGEKGLLVNTLSAHEEYYRHRARLWEIQALTRSRFVAGNPNLGRRFEQLAATLCNFKSPSRPLAALRPDWIEEIHRMRTRIELERTPPGKEALAIKTGAGGLIDVEFLAQTLCLQNGWHKPNTIQALEFGRLEGAWSKRDAEQLIEHYRALRRIEGILRRWSFAGETLLPDEPAPLLRVAVRAGFNNSADFLAAVAEHRRAIRRIYRLPLHSVSTKRGAESE